MKLTVATLFGLFLIAASCITGCKKYEDGPAISLTTKKARVANNWVIEKAFADNQDVSEDYDQYEIYLTKDGDAELIGKYTVFGTTYIVETNGTWEFRSDKSNIYLDFEDDSQDAEYQILKLEEKEFWVRQVGAELELHLKEK